MIRYCSQSVGVAGSTSFILSYADDLCIQVQIGWVEIFLFLYYWMLSFVIEFDMFLFDLKLQKRGYHLQNHLLIALFLVLLFFSCFEKLVVQLSSRKNSFVTGMYLEIKNQLFWDHLDCRFWRKDNFLRYKIISVIFFITFVIIIWYSNVRAIR